MVHINVPCLNLGISSIVKQNNRHLLIKSLDDVLPKFRQRAALC